MIEIMKLKNGMHAFSLSHPGNAIHMGWVQCLHPALRGGLFEGYERHPYDLHHAGFSTNKQDVAEGNAEETEEDEEDPYLQLPRRYRTMEAASMRLQKEAKGYLDSLRGL